MWEEGCHPIGTDVLQTSRAIAVTAVTVHYYFITIIQSPMNLECHLQQSTAARILTSKPLCDFPGKFQFILNLQYINFNPLPSAACLLDSSFTDALSQTLT